MTWHPIANIELEDFYTRAARDELADENQPGDSNTLARRRLAAPTGRPHPNAPRQDLESAVATPEPASLIPAGSGTPSLTAAADIQFAAAAAALLDLLDLLDPDTAAKAVYLAKDIAAHVGRRPT
jgi:hypothetical protein